MTDETGNVITRPMPPTSSAVSPTPPVWPTVIGVISIVFGSLGLLNGCVGLIMPFVIGKLMVFFTDAKMQAMFGSMSGHAGWSIAAGVTGMAVGGLLLASGIGSVGQRRWSTRTHAIWAVLAILQSGVSGMYAYLLQQAQFEAMQGAGVPMMPMMGEAFAAVGLLIGLMFACAYPIFMLVWLMRAPIREQVSRWN